MQAPYLRALLSRFRPRRFNFREALIPFFWIPALAIFLADNVVQLTSIAGDSMAPTLSPLFNVEGKKDIVMFWKWNSSYAAVKRGDIVCFRLPHRPNTVAAKRVVGVDGDTVFLDPKRRPQDEKLGREWDVWGGRFEVPYGHVWVEGDNRERSNDSNSYGPISKSLITGRAVSVFWPYARMGTSPWEAWVRRTNIREGTGDVPYEWEDL